MLKASLLGISQVCFLHSANLWRTYHEPGPVRHRATHRITKQESRLGRGLGEGRAVFKCLREDLTKIILGQTPGRGEGSWGVCGKSILSRGASRYKALRVQGSREASVAGAGATEIACVAGGHWWGTGHVGPRRPLM